MKKTAVLLLLLCLVGAASACSSDAGAFSNPTPAVAQQEIDQWPHNKYTAQVPEPESGVPFSAIYQEEAESYAILLRGATRQDGESYIGKLKEDGFAEAHKESEEKAVSALLQKEDVFVGVAVSDTGFAVYISFEG